MNMTTGNGRGVAVLSAVLKKKILAGDFLTGDFLPTVRDLSDAHSVAPCTAWRALKTLELDGLVEAKPRHGYRVLYESPAPEKGSPIACLMNLEPGDEGFSGLGHLLQGAMQGAAGSHDCSILSMDLAARKKGDILQELQSARVWGAVMDTYDAALVKQARESGLAVVLVDSWYPSMLVDSVVQDGFQGGFLAGCHLGEKGHKRVAWFGSVASGAHSFTRYGGAVTALRNYGVSIPEALTIEAPDSEMRARVRNVLSDKNRPTAVLALWRDTALLVAQEAQAMGLTLGDDLEIVGWCVDEQFERGFLPFLPTDYVPPTITWSAQAMARIAMTRLVERYANPDADPVRINIQTKIRVV